uniref:Methionine aminopeptidase n=1 Tax=Aegilops tauschii subsp. strangulata TaxID=200361 RepID=A0A453PNF7_AEGTS
SHIPLARAAQCPWRARRRRACSAPSSATASPPSPPGRSSAPPPQAEVCAPPPFALRLKRLSRQLLRGKHSLRRRLGSPLAGHRRVTCQATRTLSSLVDALFNRRSRDDSLESNPRRLRPGKVSPRLTVPSHIQRPPYVNSRQRPQMNDGPEIHDEKGIECMRASGKLAAQVLKFAGTLVNPGITTDEIDKAVHQMIIDNGAYPSPLGYCGFPKSVCTSVNECICHGIPDSRPLEDGDIINIDVTVYLNGYHGDTSATFLCGDVDDEAKKLVQVTKESLDKAISICAPGVEINRIGRTIQDHADKFKYGVVQQFVGHGVGKVFHAEPAVLHFREFDMKTIAFALLQCRYIYVLPWTNVS